jgi:hypothetical protein
MSGKRKGKSSKNLYVFVFVSRPTHDSRAISRGKGQAKGVLEEERRGSFLPSRSAITRRGQRDHQVSSMYIKIHLRRGRGTGERGDGIGRWRITIERCAE